MLTFHETLAILSAFSLNLSYCESCMDAKASRLLRNKSRQGRQHEKTCAYPSEHGLVREKIDLSPCPCKPLGPIARGDGVQRYSSRPNDSYAGHGISRQRLRTQILVSGHQPATRMVHACCEPYLAYSGAPCFLHCNSRRDWTTGGPFLPDFLTRSHCDESSDSVAGAGGFRVACAAFSVAFTHQICATGVVKVCGMQPSRPGSCAVSSVTCINI